LSPIIQQYGLKAQISNNIATNNSHNMKEILNTDAADIKELIRLARKYKWATGDVRSQLEDAGVNLVRSDFYSESPSLREIETSFEYKGATGSNDSLAIFDDPVIFNMERILSYAKNLVPFSESFDAPKEETVAQFYWKNSQFSGTDAITLYSLIKKEKPKTVIEIGSGFSSHITARALSELGGSRRLICIDPEPRTEISHLPGIEFVKSPIQEVDTMLFNQELDSGDLVFYDGSHTIKTGSDTVYFYLKVLPYLKKDLFVHSHDVRLPYPRNKKALMEAKLYWGEPYLLMAHLHNIRKYEVIFASDLIQRRFPDVAKSLIQEKFHSGGGKLMVSNT